MNQTSVHDIDYRSIAVITGGSSGMGLACAFRFGRHHPLVLADVNGEKLEQAAAELRAVGCSVTPVAADVTKPDSIENLVQATKSLGPMKVLLHAAGLSPTMASGKRIMEVNLVGTALIERAFLPLATHGSVAVLIASTAGHQFAHRNDPALRRPLSERFWAEIAADCESPEIAYSVSKRGVIMYCEAVAAEWGAKGARIVTIVLYLNSHWDGRTGGELRLFDATFGHRDIAPLGGRLVCFLTEGREHEVLPARRTRLSLTGWFRSRGVGAPF